MQLHALDGSGFDMWIKVNILPCDEATVDFIKNGKGIISSKVFKEYKQNNKKQSRQYLIFRCGVTLLIYSLKNNEKLLGYSLNY